MSRMIYIGLMACIAAVLFMAGAVGTREEARPPALPAAICTPFVQAMPKVQGSPSMKRKVHESQWQPGCSGSGILKLDL